MGFPRADRKAPPRKDGTLQGCDGNGASRRRLYVYKPRPFRNAFRRLLCLVGIHQWNPSRTNDGYRICMAGWRYGFCRVHRR
jgi:hypothetical protein